MSNYIKAAEKIIADACFAEYRKANFVNGKRRARHVAYPVPDWCAEFLKIIEQDNEHDIKAAIHAARTGCYSLIVA